jgi:hypothetical protein
VGRKANIFTGMLRIDEGVSGSLAKNIFVFFLVLSLFFSAFTVSMPSTTSSNLDSDNLQYYTVATFDEGLAASLHKSSLNIAEDYGYFALSKLTGAQANMLSKEGYELEPVSTQIQFPTVRFDTKDGEPSLSPELKAVSDYYVVQFIGPITQEWKDQVAKLGALNTDQYWSDNAFIMKMDEKTLVNVRALPFVNWIGTYQPAYKMASDLSEFNAGRDTIEVSVFKNENIETVISKLKSMGASFMWKVDKSNLIIDSITVVEIDASLIPQVASIPEVSTVWRWVQPQPLGDQAATEYATAADLAWYKETSGFDTPNNTWGGLTGYGQVVGILDTGFDTGSASSGHYDMFNGPLGDRMVRVQRTSTSGSGTADNLHAHGTFVTGLVASCGYCAETHYGYSTTDHVYGGDHIFTGMAPEALISFDACHDGVQDGGMYPDANLAWTRQSADGARIHVNSWGGGSGYSGDAITTDAYMWTNRDDLIFFGAGNSGPIPSTIGPPASAKNDVTVGKSGNNRPAYLFLSDPNHVTTQSSRGPFGSRNEPDICAPGECLVSLTATNFQYDLLNEDGDGDTYNAVHQPEDIYRPGVYMNSAKNVNHDYVCFSGSSVASPIAGGVCALIRQYYTDMEGITPSGILMKATLIHGAVDMDYGYPSNDQGWGRVNMKESIFPDAPATIQYYDHRTGITTGNTWNASASGMNTIVQSDRVPLKITMTQLDTSGNGGFLTNNLNLRVVDPSGTTYRGNNFVVGSIWSQSSGSADPNNLNERVLIQNPTAGTWQIYVDGATTPSGATPFAIIMSADFGTERPYKVEMTPEFNTTFKCVPGGSTTFRYNLLNFGTNYDNISLSETNLPAGLTITYTPASPVGLASNADTDVTVEIDVAGSVVPQTYRFSLIATSLNDTATPPAQDRVQVKCEVLGFSLPELIRCTDANASEDSPTIATHNDGTNDYIFITYLKYDANGPHVYLRYSTDYGNSWTERQASIVNDGPTDPRIEVYPHNSPSYPDRVLLYWVGNLPGEAYNSYVCCAYANPPYSTWTQKQVISADTGSQDPHTDHRRISGAIYQPGTGNEEFILTIECIGSSYDIDIWDVYTETGGASWLGWGATAPAASANLDFFQEVTSDELGNVKMVNYRSPGTQLRDVYFTTYNGNGAWSAQTIITSLQTAYQDVYPTIWASDEGASNNRVYASDFYTTLNPPEPPFTLFESHSDDSGSSWSTATGPYGTDASQADYATGRPLSMGVYTITDGSNWLTWLDKRVGEDPLFEVSDIVTQYTSDGFASSNLFYVTDDSLGKEHPTFASLGNTIYHVWASQREPSNKDIWMAVYDYDDCERQSNPDSVPDSEGPVVSNLGITPDPALKPSPALLTATIDETYTGFHNIQAAEYCIGTVPAWPGIAMTASDGSFNSQIEGVEYSIPTSGMPLGNYTVWVRGQDSRSNWGAAESINLCLTLGPNTPPTVDLTYPDGSEIFGGGLSKTIWWNMSDNQTPVSSLVVDLYYSVTGVDGPWIEIDTDLTGFSTPCSYNWNPVPLVNTDEARVKVRVTDTNGASAEDVSANNFEIDSTWPLPATDFRAELTGVNHVTLYWTPSASPDVAYYQIWSGLNFWNPTAAGYSLLYQTPNNANTSYTHGGQGNFSGNEVCYQIRTFDLAGHETRTIVQAAKFTKLISTSTTAWGGWIMLGSFLTQSSYDFNFKLQGQGMGMNGFYNWSAVELYNSWDTVDPWKITIINVTAPKDITTINNTQAFWVRITNAVRYASAGYISNWSILLKTNTWNLVPYPFAERNWNTMQIRNHLIANCPGFSGSYNDMAIMDKADPYRLKTPTGTETLTHQDAFWVRGGNVDSYWTVINY